MDPTQFVADYPEFGDVDVYPLSAINYWLNFGALMLNPTNDPAGGVWGNIYGQALELFAAHNLSIEFRNQAEAKYGRAPGMTTGPISGQAVDTVSVSYDPASGLDPKDTQWNLTNFGTRLIRLIRLVGAGAVQLSGQC